MVPHGQVLSSQGISWYRPSATAKAIDRHFEAVRAFFHFKLVMLLRYCVVLGSAGYLPRILMKNVLKKSLILNIRSTFIALPQSTPRRSSLRSIEVMEQLRELNHLLMAKEFQTRMEGIKLLTEYCRNNTALVSSNIIQVMRSI